MTTRTSRPTDAARTHAEAVNFWPGRAGDQLRGASPDTTPRYDVEAEALVSSSAPAPEWAGLLIVATDVAATPATQSRAPLSKPPRPSPRRFPATAPAVGGGGEMPSAGVAPRANGLTSPAASTAGATMNRNALPAMLVTCQVLHRAPRFRATSPKVSASARVWRA